MTCLTEKRVCIMGEVTILTGLNRDLRRACLMESIQRMAHNDSGSRPWMYLVVPEETTFISQRELLLRLGNSASQYIECVGTHRLRDRIYSLTGHRPECMDDGGRLLAMAAAVRSVKKNLICFKASAQRPEFLAQVLKTYDIITQNEISIEDIIENPKITKQLRDKMLDIKTIVSAYESVIGSSALDPNREEILFPKIVSENIGTKLYNTYFFVEGFSEFSKLFAYTLATLARVSAGVTISLPCDGVKDFRVSSAPTRATLNMLLRILGDEEIPVSYLNAPNTRTEHEALNLLQMELCSDSIAKPHDIENADKRVRLFVDPSMYTEIQHIAGTIMQTVRNEKYRYSDISVVLPDYERYAPVVEQVFNKYGIPAYIGSRKDEIERKPIMSAVNSALDSVTHGMQKTDVIQFLKSGIANLTMDEADRLENYALTWNIHGRGWAPDGGWVMHPDGYGKEFDDAANARLSELNEIRQRSVEPLLKLQGKLYAAETVSDAVFAMNDFLNETGFHDTVQSIVDGLLESGDRQTAMEYAQVNEVLCTALEQMNGAIGHLETKPADFARLFRMLCNLYKIATIPATIDQVQVFDLLDSRHICSKIRYIAGCVEGKFPMYDEGLAGNILTAADAQEITTVFGTRVPGTIEETTQRQMSDISSCISGAKQMLVLSYPSGTDNVASSLYQRVSQLLPKVQPTRGAGVDGIYKADLLDKQACAKLLGRISHKPAHFDITMQLAAELAGDDEVDAIVNDILDRSEWDLGTLDAVTVEDLYGEKVQLSATRSDTYASCRYHYFLKYGLNLKEPATGALDSPIFGSFAHSVLEGAIGEIEATGGFSKHTAQEVREITKRYVDKYTSEKLASLKGMPERYTYLHMRNTREILAIMNTMSREFERSSFRAEAFEYRVGGNDADMPAIEIKGDHASGEFVGIIDRVDSAIVDGKPFFRVIDYKTGTTKSVDYTDILTGKATQLILYQSAIAKARGDKEMAGILYVPAKDAIAAFQQKPDDKAIEKERQKMNQRHGLILNDEDVLRAMEDAPDGAFEFVPAKISKSGDLSGELCTAEQLQALNKFIDRQMGELVDEIHGGKVAANPISRGPERNACTYCALKSACHKDCCGTKFRYRSRVSAEEFWSEIEDRLRRD